MGFFMPDSDPRAGYFGSADLSGLNDPALLGPMPFSIPLAAIRSAFGAPDEAPSRPDADSYEIAGGPPCDGPDCQFGGTRGTTGFVPMDDGRNLCWDCAVKDQGIENRSGAEKAEAIGRLIDNNSGKSSGGSGSGGGRAYRYDGGGGLRGGGGFGVGGSRGGGGNTPRLVPF
jgi:hypothetical protein